MDLNARVVKKRQLKGVKLVNLFGIVQESASWLIGNYINPIVLFFNKNQKNKSKKDSNRNKAE
jgi:uncharacterized membrane protein